jgi:pilus assembly protein CpaB
LKRSNRLVLLIGVFLAIVAFVAVLLLSQQQPPPEQTTELDTVVAAVDIPLGVQVTTDMVTEVQLPQEGRSPTAFGDVSLVIGKTVRQPVATGAQLTAETFGETGSGGSTMDDIAVPPGRRAITVQVDQVTGVGTVIKTGDFVDMVVGIRADKFPVITTNPADDTFTIVSGINGTSVKLLLQGMQVLGTLLPPPPAQAEGQQPDGQPGTALTGQQEIVALSVDAQQAEVIKFAQMDGEISLILRATEDFIDPTTGQLLDPQPLPDATTGIILKTLVDRYGVLPPELIETVLPAQARR